MAEVLRSQALSAELWWFQFSSDVDIGSALGRQKYSFQGADETWLKVLQVYLGDTADSVFVKTSPATDQEYTATFTGFLDLSGDIIGDIIYSLMPRIMPAYPPAGIIDLSLDSEGWGARMRAATEHWEKLTGINGYAGALVYPFVHSQENPSIYELDTSELPEPVDEFAIRPIVAPGHENDFTPDQIADLVVPVAAPRHPPEFTNLRLHNPQRPWDDTITIIDGIIVFGEAGGWLKYRGMELMIARLGDPEDLLEILPYYPPGANDPNSPNYDPEAPPDGSANPPWWAKPIPPEKRPFYPWERDRPPAVELLDPADLDPGFALPCPYAPPDRVMPPITIPFPLMNLAELDLPAGDHTIIARIYNEANDYSEVQHQLLINPPVEYPSLVTAGKTVTVKRMSDIVAGFDLLAGGQEYPFTQDPKNPDTFTLDTSGIPSGIHDLRSNYEGEGSDTVVLALRTFVSRCRNPYFNIEDLLGEGRRVNPSDNVRIRAKFEDVLPVKGVDFWLKPIVEGGWGTPKVMLGSATESEEEEGVFELETSLSEATKELPDTEFQIGADVMKADDTVSEKPAASAQPAKYPKPEVDKTYKSPNYNDRKAGQEIDLIILHHTGLGGFRATRDTFMNPAADRSAHFVVDKDGTIYQMVEEEKNAWHSGGKMVGGVWKGAKYEGSTVVNSRSIGIEFVNDGDGVDEYTPEQISAGRELVDYLREKYNITDGDDHIVAHREVHPDKPDPSSNFPWEEVVPDGLPGEERTQGRKMVKPE